jgi:hypothetical protein
MCALGFAIAALVHEHAVDGKPLKSSRDPRRTRV